jgi:hypothetical protein
VGTSLVIASSYLLQQVEAEALTRSWEVCAEAAIKSEALLGTPVLEVCVSFCHEMFPFMLFILTLYPFMKYVFAS